VISGDSKEEVIIFRYRTFLLYYDHDVHGDHDDQLNHDDLVTMIAYRIFSVYQENTKTIHLIMMIWLVSFIISNYKLASGPPKDPGGSKKIFSKSKDIDS